MILNKNRETPIQAVKALQQDKDGKEVLKTTWIWV